MDWEHNKIDTARAQLRLILQGFKTTLWIYTPDESMVKRNMLGIKSKCKIKIIWVLLAEKLAIHWYKRVGLYGHNENTSSEYGWKESDDMQSATNVQKIVYNFNALIYNLHLPSPIFSIFWKSSIVGAIKVKATACITKGKSCHVLDSFQIQ